MKFVILFLLIPSNIFCTNNEFESTDEVVPMDNRRRQDCAIVIEKFLEEFSKQQAKVETKHLEEMNAVKSQLAKVETKLVKVETKLETAETKHLEEMNAVKTQLAKVETKLEKVETKLEKVETKYSEELKVVTNELSEVKMKHSEELAKVEKEHFVEVNAVKLELADVKVKHSEKLAEMITLRYDVAEAKTNCSEEVESMKIELSDTREELSKEVEEEHELIQDEFVKVRNELSSVSIENSEELDTMKEEVGDTKKFLDQFFRNCYLSNNAYLKVLPDLNVGTKFELKMKVKPEKLTGILAAIYSSSNNDFLHLQLIDGNLILTAADGDAPYNATFNLPKGFWDKGWHEITAKIPKQNIMELKVDDITTVTSYDPLASNNYIDTKGNAFFIGGHDTPNELSDILTMENFHGCIKDIQTNGNPITVEDKMIIGVVQRCF